MKWLKDPITLYKVVTPNWMHDEELLSFEVTDSNHNLTYLPGQKVTTIEPAFFFISRAHAVNYILEWRKNVNDYSLTAQLWRCSAEYVYRPPTYVPPSNAVDMFAIFWRMYYSTEANDVREIFEGLERVPLGTVLAYTFAVEDQLELPPEATTNLWRDE